MLPINPILAGAAANVVLGVGIHFAFGHTLAKIFDKKMSGLKDMPLRFAIEIISSLMYASALYIAIIIFQKSELTLAQNMLTSVYSWFVTDMKSNTDMMSALKIAGFVWLGFSVPHTLCHLAWDEKMDIRKSVVKAGLSLAHLLTMAAAIAYFA